MQNIHIFGLFLNPNVLGGGGGVGSSQLGKNPNFYRKLVLNALLNIKTLFYPFTFPGSTFEGRIFKSSVFFSCRTFFESVFSFATANWRDIDGWSGTLSCIWVEAELSTIIHPWMGKQNLYSCRFRKNKLIIWTNSLQPLSGHLGTWNSNHSCQLSTSVIV